MTEPDRPSPHAGDSRPHVTAAEVVVGLEQLGVRPGDTLMVHSSLSSLGWVDGGPDAVIDALLDAVGPAGLVVMPTLTWATVNAAQPVFHEQLTPSGVGRLTEVFRQRPQAVRSLHPTHSVAALGPDAAAFVAGHERFPTPCAPGSPYGRLVDRGGHVLLIGVGLESLTLMHAFEEWAGVPWLFNRTELLWSITRAGKTLRVPSRRHTDDPRFHQRDFPSVEPALTQAGAIRVGRIGAATVRLVDAAAARACVVPLLQADPDAVRAHPGGG